MLVTFTKDRMSTADTERPSLGASVESEEHAFRARLVLMSRHIAGFRKKRRPIFAWTLERFFITYPARPEQNQSR
jgi:hypothetical protein